MDLDYNVMIQASPAIVWKFLTTPGLMVQWMGEPEMELNIITDWEVGGSFIVKGFHHIKFENRGTILQFEPGSVLKYDHLSSISRLPDVPENHTIICFRLTPVGKQTLLTLTLSHFPTETVLKHLTFYWKSTIEVLKARVERR